MKNRLKYFNWRFLLITSFIFVSILAIVFKILSIQFVDSRFLQNEGNKRYIKYRYIVPVRGTIYDRNDIPLAVSAINYDLYALRGFTKSQLINMSEIIDLNIELDDKYFSKKTLLKKNISDDKLFYIRSSRFKNIEIEVRHSRHYPLGNQIAPLIGFYGKDGAQEGLEKSYDKLNRFDQKK